MEMNVVQRRRAAQLRPYVSPPRTTYFRKCVPLHTAALKGDWDAAQKLLRDDPHLITASITERGETALHIAAVEGHEHFVARLLEEMDELQCRITNIKGCTALTFAAAAGHLGIAQMIAHQHPSLVTFIGRTSTGEEGVTPLFMAALIGHLDVANYLFPLSDFPSLHTERQIELLNVSIESGLYDLAVKIVHENNNLASVADGNGRTPLAILARNPSYSVVGLMKLRNANQETTVACDAYALFHLLWDSMISQQDIEPGVFYDNNTCRLGFIAAESGNYHFLVELIRRDPIFLYKVNESLQSIFHIAVKHRYADIFNLIYEVIGMKDLMATYVDHDTGNNMLHLAGIIAPQLQLDDIPGAALKMQREVLWYKEVEKNVQPLYRNTKNLEEKTPHELFLEQHGPLMKEGEKEMKHNAKSFMLVTMLITTVVFAAAFTVPGGYDNTTGVPILGKRTKGFVIFPICEGVATLSSLVSMLMFLSILTSRYAERDFVTTLPFWLVNGVMALFVSIVAMVGALCSSILFYEHGLAAAIALIVLFGSVPMMFVALKYQMLVGILKCTFGGRWLFGSNNCLFRV